MEAGSDAKGAPDPLASRGVPPDQVTARDQGQGFRVPDRLGRAAPESGTPPQDILRRI